MTKNPIEWIVGDFDDKKRWRAYKSRVNALPAPYRESADALERYLMHFGATDGDNWLQAFDDLADLFEGAVADGTTVREIVGADPVEFAETFASNYGGAGWINKEKRRLNAAIDQAEAQQGAS